VESVLEKKGRQRWEGFVKRKGEEEEGKEGFSLVSGRDDICVGVQNHSKDYIVTDTNKHVRVRLTDCLTDCLFFVELNQICCRSATKSRVDSFLMNGSDL